MRDEHGGWRIEDRGWNIATFYLLLSSIFVLAGCSKLVAVEGTVTLDAKPLPEAAVTFIPKSDSDGQRAKQPAYAITDAHGSFRLGTVNREGVLPGIYKVVVSKKALPSGGEETPPKDLGEAMLRSMRKVQLVPKIYGDLKTTPLEIEVPENGRRDLAIELDTRSGSPVR